MFHSIILQQPYASMLVLGLRNAVRNEHFSRGQRIFVYATVPKYDPDTPLEWLQEVINQQLFGNLLPTEDLPIGLCLGFVDVLCAADMRDGIWAAIPEQSVVVHNAHAFDEPQLIMPRKGFEADDIPSHKFTPRDPHSLFCDDELLVPVSQQIYDAAAQGGNVTFELAGSLAIAATDERGLLKEFSKFTLSCGHRSKTYLWNIDCEVIWEQAPPTYDLVLYPSVRAASSKIPRARLRLSCRYPLID